MDPGMITGSVLIGLLAGMLVGLTGIGGGVLLLPLLVSVLGVPPMIAVGSDALISCLTKIGAGGLHWYQGNVRWRLVFQLSCGSVPGAVLGVTLLQNLHREYGSAVNDFLRIAIGALLVVIPCLYLVCLYVRNGSVTSGRLPEIKNGFGITIIGFVAGVLVGVTSIGAGSVILLMLLIFYGLAPANAVGTDIVHGVLLAGVTGLLQFKVGNVDLILVAAVLAGSIPGSILGVYLTRHLPSVNWKGILCALLVGVGARILWTVLRHGS